MSAPRETDALVVGAGPVGLFAVFELGLLEVHAEIVDSLPAAGGQCVELYADKPIYDIPGLPYCTGRELIDRLQQQIAPFRAGFHLGRQVAAVAARADGRFDVETDAGDRFTCKAIVVAGGVGSFQPRRLKIEGLDRHRGAQLIEAEPGPGIGEGRRVVICGAGAAAVSAAIAAATGDAANVTLVHRKDEFDAPGPMLDVFRRERDAGRITVVTGMPNAIVEGNDGRLTGLVVAANDGSKPTLPLDLLFVLLGWAPRLGPIAQWGVALEKKQVTVDTARFETSTPGIFAVGDINTYPGKKKLIVSGFHEATLAAYAVAERMHPGRAEPLLYTTTSPKLHRLLGVEQPLT